MPGPSTWLSSITSPVLMSRAARSTFAGFFMWLPEPRSSPAPHFEGQRWLSGGTFHWPYASTGIESTVASAMRFMCFLLFCRWLDQSFVQALVVESAAHRRELVAELAHVRRHAVGLEGLARLPALDDGEMIRPVGLLHDLVAQAALVLAAGVAQGLEQRDRVVLARRHHVHVRDHVQAAAGAAAASGADRERDVDAVVGGAVAQRLELVAQLLVARGVALRFEGLLVL